jgi:hypothetical protein
VPIYAPGVTLGISRKMQKEPGRIVNNRLNRPVKGTCNQRLGNYGHFSEKRFNQEVGADNQTRLEPEY